MKKAIYVAAAVAALGGLIVAGIWSLKKPAEVKVFAAAGLRVALDETKPAFESQNAPAVLSFDYGGTNQLLGRLKALTAPEYRPDVFIAAEETYAREAEQQGLVDRVVPLAYQTPVLAVSNKATVTIEKLSDLAGEDVKKVSLGDPKGPAVGKVADALLAKAGLADVRKKAVSRDTVQDVALDIALGHADAGIIWDTIASQGDFRDKMRVIPIPGATPVAVLVCRVAKCPHPDLADAYIKFLTTSDAARQAFRKHGFVPAGEAASAPATRSNP